MEGQDQMDGLAVAQWENTQLANLSNARRLPLSVQCSFLSVISTAHAGSFLFWVLRGMRVYGTCLTSPGRTQGENSSSVASQCALCAPYCNTHLVPLGQRTRINSDWHLRACSTVR